MTLRLPDAGDFAARLLQDCLTEATAGYWRRRARTFADAMSRPGDFPGDVTAEQRTERDAQLAAVVRACLARAEVSLLQTEADPDITAALQEVA